MGKTNWDRNQANDGKDYFGRELIVGQLVCKPTVVGRSAVPEIRTVFDIKNGKIYLNPEEYTALDGTVYRGKVTAINYSGRLIILSQPDGLFEPSEPKGVSND